MTHCGTHPITTERLYLRRSDWNNQGICDACYYGLLREEWQK